MTKDVIAWMSGTIRKLEQRIKILEASLPRVIVLDNLIPAVHETEIQQTHTKGQYIPEQEPTSQRHTVTFMNPEAEVFYPTGGGGTDIDMDNGEMYCGSCDKGGGGIHSGLDDFVCIDTRDMGGGGGTNSSMDEGVVPVDSAFVANEEDTLLNLSEGRVDVAVELLPGFGWTPPSTGVSKIEHAEHEAVHFDVNEIENLNESESDDDVISFFRYLKDPLAVDLRRLEDISELAAAQLLVDVAEAVINKLGRECSIGRANIANASALMIIKNWSSRASSLLRNDYNGLVQVFCQVTCDLLGSLADSA